MKRGCTRPVQDSCSIREAVCIHTKKIYDSCRDKDCIRDLRVYPTRSSQAVIDRALSVRGGRAELLQAYIDVEPASYNRGFFSVDIRYYYRITAEAFVGGSRPAEISGLAVFDKRVLLFGSEGNAKIFTSRYRPEEPDCQGLGRSNLPEAVVEAVDPIVLSLKLIDPCDFVCPPPCPPPCNPCNPCPPPPPPPCGCCAENELTEIPPCISACFDCELAFDRGLPAALCDPGAVLHESQLGRIPSCSSPCTTTACPPGSVPAAMRMGTTIPARSSARFASLWASSSPPAPCRGWKRRKTAAAAPAAAAAVKRAGRPWATRNRRNRLTKLWSAGFLLAGEGRT